MKEDRSYDALIDRDKVPSHVAVIMDGNGRWARSRGWVRTRGHEVGVRSVRAVTRMCGRLGVREVTLFAFSSENWKRPKREVDFLMRLMEEFVVSERKTVMENDVRVSVIGRLGRLPIGVRRELRKTVEMSQGNKGLLLRLALNYGGRQEIVDAARRMAEQVRQGELDPEDLTPETFRRFFYDQEMSDPDLLIRTGGEMRLSNFLLWQLSYSELYVTPVCWPDFREAELAEAFKAYASRERRFGGLKSETPSRASSPVS